MENHLNIRNQFVNYEIALKLKELGFDEECLTYYIPNRKLITEIFPNTFNVSKFNSETNHIYGKKGLVSAPLWQQCLDWFREKQDIHIVINHYNDEEANQILYDFTIFEKDWNDVSDYIYYHSFQEAREQAILKAIELIKKDM